MSSSTSETCCTGYGDLKAETHYYVVFMWPGHAAHAFTGLALQTVGREIAEI